MRRRLPAVVAIVLQLPWAATVAAHRLEARWSDHEASRFGATVASDGAHVAVAGPAGPTAPGLVAVYDRAGALVLRHTSLEPEFGRGLLLTDDAVFVGAPGASSQTGRPGAVERLPLSGADPDLRRENPTDGPGGFGAALAVVGARLAVGAPGDAGEHGAVHLYLPDATSPERTLRAPGAPPPAGDRFGATLAASGDRLVVGAPGDDQGAHDAGRVWVFDAATGTLLYAIPAPQPAFGGAFGTALAILPDAIAVGAPGAPHGSLAAAGGVWVFDAADGALRGRLTDPQPLERGRFGTSLALAGGFLAIGAPGSALAPPTAGMVHVVLPAADALLQTLIPPERLAAVGAFGTSVTGTADGTIVAGAPFADVAGEDDGAAYRFGMTCPLCPPCHRCDPDARACVPDAVCVPSAWLLGDSITSQCGARVAEAAAGWTITNHGRPLDVAAQGRSRLELLLDQAESLPHVAQAFLGTNDLTFARILGVPHDRVAADVAATMASIRARFDEVRVPSAIGLPLGWPRDLRAQVPDPVERREMEDGVRALRRALHPLRPTVNLGLGNPRLYSDLIHPSDLGCDVIARRTVSTLRRLLRAR